MLGRLVTIAAFENAMQATLVKNHLEAAGIRSVLADEFTASNFWQLSNAIGGVKVQIAEEDFERASRVLDEVEGKRRDTNLAGVNSQVAFTSDTETEEEAAEDAVVESKPGEEDEEDEPPLNAREDIAERARKTVMIGLVFMPLQFYATWQLLDVWQSDLPLRPAVLRKLYWTIALHLPLLILATLIIGFALRGATR